MSMISHLGYFPVVSPWSICIPSGTPDSNRPIGVSLTDAMRYYWRVKAWKIDFDLAITEDPPVFPQAIAIGSASASRTTNSGVLVTDEATMVCGTNRTLISFSGDSYSGSATLFLTTSTPLITNSGLYYPRMGFQITVGDVGISTLDSGFMSAIAADIDGVPVVTYYSGGTGGVPSGTISVYPIEYWPHDPGDGPIWDASTGALLRPGIFT